MRLIAVLILLCTFSVNAQSATPQCEEIGRRAAASVARLDTAFRLQGARLKGEIEMSKTALLGCVAQNKQVETRASLLWFLLDFGFLAGVPLLFLHQRRMRKAIRALNVTVAAQNPDHSKAYLPGQWYFRSLIGLLAVGFLGLNLVALVL
jgi:hypothetical protein